MKFYFLPLMLITLLTFSFAWVRLQLVTISYDIHALSVRESALREEINRLTFALNSAKSPRALEKLATQKLNLYPPVPGQIIPMSEP